MIFVPSQKIRDTRPGMTTTPLPNAVLQVTEYGPVQLLCTTHPLIHAGNTRLIFAVNVPVRIIRSFAACRDERVILEPEIPEMAVIPYEP